jgi:acyl carrier protein
LRDAERIRQFILSTLLTFDDEVTIEDAENIFETGFVDSSFAMQLVVFLQQEFGIQVTDDDLELSNFSTIDRMVRFVRRKKADGR